jgi:hypothetical protein
VPGAGLKATRPSPGKALAEPVDVEMGDRLPSIRAQSAKAEQTGREEGQR